MCYYNACLNNYYKPLSLQKNHLQIEGREETSHVNRQESVLAVIAEAKALSEDRVETRREKMRVTEIKKDTGIEAMSWKLKEEGIGRKVEAGKGMMAGTRVEKETGTEGEE